MNFRTMPTFETHKKAGFIFSIIFTILFSILLYSRYPFLDWKLLYAPAVIWFYSNLPDVDLAISRIRRYLFYTIFIGLSISAILFAIYGDKYIIIGISILGLLGVFILGLKHRGIMHYYTTMLLCSLPLLLIHWFLFALAITSSFSHIFIDRLWSGTKRKAKKIFGWKTSRHTTIKIFSK